MRALVVVFVLLAFPATADPYNTAVLQGLDKVTARVSTIEAPVGDNIKF